MSRERISIVNLLRASEIFLNEHDHYSPSELKLLQGMLRRLSSKVSKARDTENPTDHT